MKIVKPHIEELTFHTPDNTAPARWLEKLARTCYKSEGDITVDSALPLIQKLYDMGHMTVFEHLTATARIIGDRGLSHELVRHRVASFLQESTRFCNYSKGKFNEEITVIEQPELKNAGTSYGTETEAEAIWWDILLEIESAYLTLIDLGVSPQIARSVLPIGLKAEIVITAT